MSTSHISAKELQDSQEDLVPKSKGAPFRGQALSQEMGPLPEHLCHGHSTPKPTLSSLPCNLFGVEERNKGKRTLMHLSSSSFFFLMSSMRSRRFWASSLRRRPSSKIAIRFCTCFCWFSRTCRRSSLACCRRPVAFFSSSSRSFSICSL